MSSDVLPETQAHQQPPRSHQCSDDREPSQGGWWKSGLFAIGLLAVLVPAVALIPGANSSREQGPVLTHTITRGDLIVTVTEQGTLESSENTEIKCKVRGQSTVIWVVESGAEVEPGDELVRLDTLALEDAIAERTKYAHLTKAGAERARATVEAAKLAIPQYEEGTYRTQLMGLEKDLAIAGSGLVTAKNMLAHAKMMAGRGYKSELEVQQKTFAVMRAENNVEAVKTSIGLLKDYTRKMEMATLEGNLKAARARLAAEEERSKQDAERRDLAIKELEYCVVKAEKSGMLIHPSAASWKEAPEIEEGASVHLDQVMLLMPDLSKMQVKVGIHESIVDRVKPGLAAKVTLPDKTLDGKVTSVAPITRPAGWWTGNVVKYDTIVELPSTAGLKPGMSAEVEVIMACHEDVLTIPVAAVLQTTDGDFCWVKTEDAAERRSLELGDSDDQFIVLEAGLEEGEEVVLDPLASIEEAQILALEPFDETEQ